MAALLSLPAQAQKSADTLRIVWRDALPNVDPYFNNARTGLIVAHQAFDTLLYRDPETLRLKPLLAQSWKWVDDRTLEFELRPGVKFHNGDPVTAADVEYTYNTVSSPQTRVSVPSNFVWIDHAEAVGDHTVRVTLKRVFPAAVEYVSMVLPIWPKAYRERVGADEYAKQPIGAGPYRITRVDGVREIDLERFDDYYADSPKGRPAIRRIVIKEVPEEATQVTMLLGNQADWIWYFNADSFDNIAKMPTLQAIRAESMRYGFISLDAAGRTGVENPLTNLKVRQAIFHAIDRATIAKTLIKGGSRELDAPCYPSQFGCDQAGALHYDYDPAKAKAIAGRGRLQGWHRHGIGHRPAAAMGGRAPELPGRGRHPCAAHDPGRRCGDAAAARGQGAALRQFLGLLFNQRRLRRAAVLLLRRCGGLHARCRGDAVCARGRRGHRSRCAAQGLQRGDPAHHRAGILPAAVELLHDLRFLAPARLQALAG